MSKPKTKVPAKIKKLAHDLDEMAKVCVEYQREESSAHAEYCQSFGYGDGEIELNRLSDELQAKVRAFKKLTGKDFRAKLADVCTLELTGIYTTNDEVFSCIIGEVEEQMSDALAKRVKRLNAAEIELLRREMSEACLGHSCPDCIYINMDYDRWVMRVNEDELDQVLAELGWVNPAETEIENPLFSETPESRRNAFRLIQGGAA